MYFQYCGLTDTSAGLVSASLLVGSMISGPIGNAIKHEQLCGNMVFACTIMVAWYMPICGKVVFATMVTWYLWVNDIIYGTTIGT